MGLGISYYITFRVRREPCLPEAVAALALVKDARTCPLVVSCDAPNHRIFWIWNRNSHINLLKILVKHYHQVINF